MKTDNELRHDVELQLEWEPSVDERRIGVSVVDGVVTLTGEVGSYAEKWKAERTVERVSGVRGIANEVEVRSRTERSDADIAQSAVSALKWNVMVPSDDVKVKVENGWLTFAVRSDGTTSVEPPKEQCVTCRASRGSRMHSLCDLG